jgi:hypothetical protein
MIMSLLADVGSKVPLRWFTGIVLPGVLLTVTIACVHGLGWAHAFDYSRAQAQANALLGARGGKAGASTFLTAVIVVGGTAIGFLAQVASQAVSAAWLRAGRPGRHLKDVAAEIGYAHGGGEDFTGINLSRIWPRIWLLCPDAARREIQAAWDQYAVSALLGTWGIIYLLLGCWWPPALIAGAALIGFAYWQAVRAIATFAELTRAVVDITITQLALIPGISIQPGRAISEQEARDINEILRSVDAAAIRKSKDT